MKKLFAILFCLLPLYIQAQTGCSDPAALNYFCNTSEGETSCVFSGIGADGSPVFSLPLGFIPDDGSCYYNPGCTDPAYLEYDATADFDDGSCSTIIVLGCTNPNACNYNVNANSNDGSCTFPSISTDCDGNCYQGFNDFGSGCEQIVLGCTDPTALNYDSESGANTDDGSCVESVLGCTDATAFNYSPDANTDDGSCVPFIYGCTDVIACNYGSNTNTDDGSCTYTETYYDCDGSCLVDTDLDSVSDELEVLGCQDDTACNYNYEATDSGVCTYAAENADCEGNCVAGYADFGEGFALVTPG